MIVMIGIIINGFFRHNKHLLFLLGTDFTPVEHPKGTQFNGAGGLRCFFVVVFGIRASGLQRHIIHLTVGGNRIQVYHVYPNLWKKTFLINLIMGPYRQEKNIIFSILFRLYKIEYDA